MSASNNSSSNKPNQAVQNRGPGRRMQGLVAPTEKPRDFKRTIIRLATYLLPYKTRFIVVMFLAIASTGFSIIGPKVLGLATTKLGEGILAKYQYFLQLQYAISNNLPLATINRLKHTPIPGFDFAYIGKILLIMGSLYVISALCSYTMSYLMAGVAQNTVYDLRNQMKAKFDRLPLKYFDSRPHGELLSRVTNDLDNIATTLQQSLTQLITSVISIIGVLCMMFSISFLLSLIALVTLPVCMLVTMKIAKYSQRYFARQQKHLGELNGHVEEMITGHKIIKAFGKEDDSIRIFRESNNKLYDAGWKAQFVSGIIFPAIAFINNIGYVLVCIFGGLMVAQRTLDIGDIQAFIQYMRNFSMPITQTANIANVIQSAIASAERVFEVLDEDEEVAENHNPLMLQDPKGNVEFNHLYFSYNPESPLIENLNIDVKSGQMVAIVGPTGAGKTTLVNLLMRFYELDGGYISIDGVKTTDISRSNLRQLFGMVLQDTWLFNGTIKDNIAYGRVGASDEDIYQAAKAAHADHFIRTLPHGYNTVLNEEASNISQGQKQLLTIARAILADPPILILDEATSNVDTRTEVLIQKAMANLMKDRTTFIIAHRLSTIKNADSILVMNQGKIIEQGNHQELLAAQGFYADLYNSQFEQPA